METFRLVLPENLNHYGYLFGGYMLKWVDEFAWIAATLDFPDYRFVTIAMDRVEFRKSVKQGAILRFATQRVRIGRTSIHYRVDVWRHADRPDPDDTVFTTTVTLVRVDKDGNKAPIED